MVLEGKFFLGKEGESFVFVVSDGSWGFFYISSLGLVVGVFGWRIWLCEMSGFIED